MKEIIIISPVNDGMRSPALFTLHNLLKTKKGKQGGRGGGGVQNSGILGKQTF